MKIYLSICFISLLFIGSATAQQRFEPTAASRTQAITSGQGREYIAAMEALGEQEASKKERLGTRRRGISTSLSHGLAHRPVAKGYCRRHQIVGSRSTRP